MIRILFIVIVFFLIALVPLTYWGVVFIQKYQISMALIGEATPFEHLTNDHSTTLLVVGDSTGVGVGALRPEDTVAGRLASAMQATYVENRAVSGAVVADIEKQLEGAKLSDYDVILIQVGGNDIVRFHDPNKTADMLSESVRKAVEHSSKTILMSAGDVGATTNFPEPIRPQYTKLTLRFHDAFGTMAAKEGAIYINLYEPPETDPFRADPEKYLSIDGFHPSSDGYELWFEKLESVISI